MRTSLSSIPSTHSGRRGGSHSWEPSSHLHTQAACNMLPQPGTHTIRGTLGGWGHKEGWAAQWVGTLAAKPDDLDSLRPTRWKEGTDFHRLSSDPHMHTMPLH